MARKETSIEVKVGGLVLLAIAILAAFVLVLGDFSFSQGFVVYVDFDNAAGLKPGAPVRVSGIPAGSVKSVDFIELGEGADGQAYGYVRATLRIDEEMHDTIFTDSRMTITTQGVLGEPYVEIDSTATDGSVVDVGHIFDGIDPPRMDQLLTEAYETISGISDLVDRLNERGPEGMDVRIGDFINNIADLAGNIDERIVENKEEIDNIFANVDSFIAELESEKERIGPILENVESATGEFDVLGGSLNRAVGDGSQIRRTIGNVEDVSEVAAREAEPLMVSIREAAESAERILTENEEQIATTIDNVDEITSNLVGASDDAEEIIARVERGEGNLGRLLQDEEIFEDMREFVRELKRRPWRIIWKE